MPDEPTTTPEELAPDPVYRSAVAIYSHALRAEVLAGTIAAFEAVGVPPDVVQVQTAAPRQVLNRLNAREAIKRALEEHVRPRDLPGILLLEDDVRPASTLAAWLGAIEATQDRPVTLYAGLDRFYPHRIARAVAIGDRPAKRSEIVTIDAENRRRWWGSQAVWIPTELAEIIVRDARIAAHERTLGPFDHALRALLAERGATLGLAVPNVVQHLEERNLVAPTKRPTRSATFQQDAPAPTR